MPTPVPVGVAVARNAVVRNASSMTFPIEDVASGLWVDELERARRQ